VKVYLDASVLVALFTNDPFTGKADEFLRHKRPALTVSDFAKAEFASAIARGVRTNELTTEEARMAFSAVDV
jgi:predicted nucleic acid-binding protein